MATELVTLNAILQGNYDFKTRLIKKTEEVKKDKETLLEAAKEYTKQFEQEIEEGTKKRQLLLTEGQKLGLTEEEIFKDNTQFLMCKNTPILNMLYILTRDVDTKLKLLQEKYNKQFGAVTVEEAEKPEGSWYNEKELLNANNVPKKSMDSYLFENIDHPTFEKLKKLKELTKSDNINEAALSFKKFRELCSKYKLDPDRIP